MFVIVTEVYIMITHKKEQLIFTFQLVKDNIPGLIKTIYVSIWRSIYHSNHNIAMFVKHTSINFYENWFKNIIRSMWIISNLEGNSMFEIYSNTTTFPVLSMSLSKWITCQIICSQFLLTSMHENSKSNDFDTYQSHWDWPVNFVYSNDTVKIIDLVRWNCIYFWL